MAGGGRRKRGSKKNNPKARQSVKDHFVHAQNESPLAEELIALSSIFREDFRLISEEHSFTEFSISLQPHSGGIGSSLNNVSAELHIRCFAGYPYKPPKLHVIPKEGILEAELASLHSMLIDQATSSSREGRVMIFNLVEAAREFLSEHVGSRLLHEHQGSQDAPSGIADDSCEGIPDKNTSGAFTLQSTEDLPSVFGVVDLFTELRDDLHWDDESQRAKQHSLQRMVASSLINKSLGRRNLVTSRYGVADPEMTSKEVNDCSTTRVPNHANGRGTLSSEVKLEVAVNHKQGASTPAQLTAVSENEENVFTTKTLTAISELLDMICSEQNKNSTAEEGFLQPVTGAATLPSLILKCPSSVRKDFLLAHLLRLVCSPKGPLPHAWPAVVLQLHKFNVIPHWAVDLLLNQSELFNPAFCQLFADCIKDTSIQTGPVAAKAFWNANDEIFNGSSEKLERNTSRYANDFEEISLLGRGGFGYVVLCRNNLDGRCYAVKKIRLKDRSLLLNKKIIREVATLSRLQHHHIVRYYQAWFETVIGASRIDLECESTGDCIFSSKLATTESSFNTFLPKAFVRDEFEEENSETICLYIQMEYCPRTLREILDSNTENLDDVTAWGFFRQIVEGLTYIHAQGIIHRDLTPSNIFFDVRNDIKIGDFGLAKFTNLEQADRESFVAMDQYGSSLDGTGQVGTYLYTAPEIENIWPQIDEKADMYSLGIILFELWHPFSTAMERHVVLTELKNRKLPPSWEAKHPHQASLVQNLTASNPADRPSAMHVLRNNLPPRMEDEALYDVLRTIQREENTYVLDQIVSALFDEERVSSIAQKLDREQFNFLSIEKRFCQDQILGIAKDVFVSHGALRFPSQSLSLIDEGLSPHRQTVKLIDSAGRMLVLRSDMRSCFARWVASNQVSSIKRFEISQVYRKAAGPSAPDEFYQGDFNIIGETFGLAEAEAIKVVVDIIHKSAVIDSYDIRLNHASILEAIWIWSGVKNHERRNVAKLLSSVGCAPPQSSERKSRWVYVRQQLVQGLQLKETVVNRLQTVERRWSGTADEALPRIRGGLADSNSISTAIDELSTLQSYLRVWTREKHVYIDALMAPMEEYCKGIYFQIHIPKGSCHATSSMGMLLAAGGRYDQLIERLWTSTRVPAPAAVGVSIALEKLILAAAAESHEQDSGVDVLVCSKGGGGLLKERMEIVSELWDGNIKAEFLHSPSPSVTEQYEFANEHGIKWLVMITEAGLTHGNVVKVRNMDSRKDEDIHKEELVKYLTDVICKRTRPPFVK